MRQRLALRQHRLPAFSSSPPSHEGTTEAVDQHLQVAGALIAPGVAATVKARTAVHAGRYYAAWLPKLAVGAGQKPTSYDEFGPLAKHVRFVERSARKLARSTFYGMSRWQAKLGKKQVFLGRIVDIGAELVAMSATCVYANTLTTNDPAHADEAMELAALFCSQARRRVDRLFHDLWFNDDEENHAAARHVLDGRYEFFERDVVDALGSAAFGSAVEGAAAGRD